MKSHTVVRISFATGFNILSFFAVITIGDCHVAAQSSQVPAIASRWESYATADFDLLLTKREPTEKSLHADVPLQTLLSLMAETCDRLQVVPTPSAEERISILEELTAVRNRIADSGVLSNKHAHLCNWMTQLRQLLVADLASEDLSAGQVEAVLTAAQELWFFNRAALDCALADRIPDDLLTAESAPRVLILKVLRAETSDISEIDAFDEALARLRDKGKAPSLTEYFLGDSPTLLVLDLQAILENDARTLLEANMRIGEAYKSSSGATAVGAAFKGLSEDHVEILTDTAEPTLEDKKQVLREMEANWANLSEYRSLWKYSLTFLQRVINDAQGK